MEMDTKTQKHRTQCEKENEISPQVHLQKAPFLERWLLLWFRESLALITQPNNISSEHHQRRTVRIKLKTQNIAGSQIVTNITRKRAL